MKFARIGATVVAVFALMGLAAASASAATFQSTSYPNMSAGSQEGEHVFKVDGQSVKCTTASFEGGEQSGAAATETVKASYSGCTAFGFVGATVTMNKCHYKFGITEPSAKKYHGKVEIFCDTAGTGNIKIVSSSAFGTCEVEVGQQTEAGKNAPEGLNTYENIEVGGVKKVKVSSNVTGIDVNVLKDSGICPLSGTGARTNSTYEGVTIMGATGGAGAFVG